MDLEFSENAGSKSGVYHQYDTRELLNSDYLPQADPRRILSEFACSAFESGVARPLESFRQIAGFEPASQEPDNITLHEGEKEGLLQLANITGHAAGQILDFAILHKICGNSIGRALNLLPAESAAARALAQGKLLRSVATSGAVGFVNGSLLTPLQEGESSWRRLANGTVDAASFAALSSVSGKLAGKFENTFTGRAKVNFLAGTAGGVVNSVMDPLMHGQLPGLKEAGENTLGWAIGNVLIAESLHAGNKGIKNIRNLTEHFKSSETVLTEKVISTLESGTTAKVRETVDLRPPTGLRPQVELEAARANDAVKETGGARGNLRLEMRSMRELAQSGDRTALEEAVTKYHEQLQKAFPLPGEIETVETYVEYLRDPESSWEMEHLIGKKGEVVGGLQYQVLPVEGEKLKNAGWLEHIWVDEGSRQEGYGSGLLKHVQSQIKKGGGDATFWEFNNPDKMTPLEIAEDAKGGITTQDRVDYWAKRGSYVLRVPSTGELAPYAQPGMDGQEPVTYLSTAWNAPEGLEGQRLPKSDYKKVLLSAHRTIVDVESDPTVKEYLSELDAIKDQELEFVRLSDYLKSRAERLNAETKNGVPGAEARRLRWIGQDRVNGRTLIDIAGIPNENPELTRVENWQSQTKSP